MFGKLLDKLRGKSEPSMSDLKITDLKNGYIFDYNLKSWEVIESGKYTWGGKALTKEHKVSAGDETKYLSVSDGSSLVLTLSDEININKVDLNLRKYILDNDEPMNSLTYNGERYDLTEESMGHYKEDGDDESFKTIEWMMVNATGEKFVSISRWDEREINAYTGIFLKDYEISNILGR